MMLTEPSACVDSIPCGSYGGSMRRDGLFGRFTRGASHAAQTYGSPITFGTLTMIFLPILRADARVVLLASSVM